MTLIIIQVIKQELTPVGHALISIMKRISFHLLEGVERFWTVTKN